MKQSKKFFNHNEIKLELENGIEIVRDDTERNKEFEKLCLYDQASLKTFLYSELSKYGPVVNADGFLYMQGTFPVLLIAHMDTVHKELPKEIVYDNGCISSPQGIGGDDRCGIYMTLSLLKRNTGCSVLFLEDEEIGCKGAKKFCNSDLAKSLKDKFYYLVEMDRMGSYDAVFYECDNPEFTAFIIGETKGYWEEAEGSFTDIVEIAPELNAAAVNFSCGYQFAHSIKEYVNLSRMETNINEIQKVLERTTENDKFEFMEREYVAKGFYDWDAKFYGSYFFFIKYLVNGNVKVDEVEAYSEEEAIGRFLMSYPDLCYNNVLEVLDENTWWDSAEAMDGSYDFENFNSY